MLQEESMRRRNAFDAKRTRGPRWLSRRKPHAHHARGTQRRQRIRRSADLTLCGVTNECLPTDSVRCMPRPTYFQFGFNDHAWVELNYRPHAYQANEGE